MNERKNSFVLYLDYWYHIERLTLKQRGNLLTAIFAHTKGEDKPEMDAVTSMAFSFIASQLDRDQSKWEETRRVRVEAGKKGGTVSGQNRKQTKQMLNVLETPKQNEANEAVNVTVTVTDTVTVNETVTDNEKKNRADKPPSPSASIRFSPPSVDEVKAYCIERGNNVDPQYFVDFYTSKGWKVGKDKMKDWKASVRTWEKRNNEERKANSRDAIKTAADYESEDDFFAGTD